jgi:hypothetical protein
LGGVNESLLQIGNHYVNARPTTVMGDLGQRSHKDVCGD